MDPVEGTELVALSTHMNFHDLVIVQAHCAMPYF